MDILKKPTINFKALENIVEKGDFGLLKRELYKYIRTNFKELDFYNVETINNFDFSAFAKSIILNSYYMENNVKKIKYYTFSPIQEYYNILDFIILYSYQITQGIYIKKTQENYYQKSLTEILTLSRKEFTEYGLVIKYPFHLLSENYRTNVYIQNYLTEDDSLELLSDIDTTSFSEKENNFYLIALDIVKLIETKQGMHYKMAKPLLKDRLFALAQCLKQINKDNAYVYKTLDYLVNEYKLPIGTGDIQFISNSAKYKYTIETLSEKIKYNYVRSKEFNYYTITGLSN